MTEATAMPERFSADGLPTDGLVEILDQKTGRSGKIPVSAFPHVTSLLGNLFPSDDTSTDEAKSEPAAGLKPIEASPVEDLSTDEAQSDESQALVPEETPTPAAAPAPKQEAAPKPKKVRAAPAKKSPAKAPAKKAKPATQKSSKPTTSTDLDVISGKGFELVPGEDGGAYYNIICDDGRNAGQVNILETGHYVVKPDPETGFEEQEYTNIVGAKARVFVITR